MRDHFNKPPAKLGLGEWLSLIGFALVTIAAVVFLICLAMNGFGSAMCALTLAGMGLMVAGKILRGDTDA